MSVSSASFSLVGRTALVTGAAQGIGATIATTFATAGADVAICDRDEIGLDAVAAAIVAAGRRAWTEVLDVRDRAAASSFVARVAADAGTVDVLVNNAGGGFAAPFLDVSDGGVDALIRENFTSAASFIQLVVPRMAPPGPGRSGGGAVISITSIEAHRAAPGYAVYAAMKAALESLTRTLSLELGERHVTVNCIAPDVIPTPGIGGEVPVETPLPWSGHTDDVAAAALFLASDAARFVTGTTLHVDGGNLAAGGWWRAPDGTYRVSHPEPR